MKITSSSDPDELCLRRPTYRFLSALAGSGKTRLIAGRAHRLARAGFKVLILQPTHLLIAATIAREIMPLEPQYPVTQIHGGNGDTDIISKIVRYFLHASPDQGEIVLITHAAHRMVPHLHAKDRWIVIQDEAYMDMLAHDTVRLPDTHSIVTDHIEAIPYRPGYSELKLRDGSVHRRALEAIAANENDDEIYRLVSTFAKLLLDQHYAVHVREDRYLAMLRSEEKTSNQIVYFGCLRPTVLEGFREVVVCCAMFEQSLMYLLWRLEDEITWEAVGARTWRTAQLKYSQFHPNGSMLTIYYATKQPWSKRFRDETIEGDDTLFMITEADGTKRRKTYGDVFQEAVASFTQSHRKKTCWLGNKDQGSTSVWVGDCPERLPASSHGLNDYQANTYCAITAAYNPPATLFAYLQACGIDAGEVRQAIYYANVYQGAVRCAIRDPENREYKHLIVMDKDVADWLAGYFPGCYVQALPGTGLAPERIRKQGRPRIHAEDADRRAAHRQRIAAELLGELADINQDEITPIETDQAATHRLDLDRFVGTNRGAIIEGRKHYSIYNDIVPSKSIQTDLSQKLFVLNTPSSPSTDFSENAEALQMKNRGEPLVLPIFESVTTSGYLGQGIHVEIANHDQLIDLLKDFAATNRCEAKTDSPLICPANFGTEPNTRRCRDNVLHTYGIFLDCDDGRDLTPEKLASIFPRLRMATYSTFSSTPEHPKWRAFIPTSQTMSIRVQQHVVKQLLQILNDAGYWSHDQLAKRKMKSRLTHGFDPTKFTPEQLFYLPSSPIGKKVEYHDFNDDLRGPLDVALWIERCILNLRPEIVKEDVPKYDPLDTVSIKARQLALALKDQRASSRTYGINDRAVERALDDWRACPRGEGHNQFYKLGARLLAAGMAIGDVEIKLAEVYAWSGSKSEDRRREIHSVIQGLGKWGGPDRIHGNSRRL